MPVAVFLSYPYTLIASFYWRFCLQTCLIFISIGSRITEDENPLCLQQTKTSDKRITSIQSSTSHVGRLVFINRFWLFVFQMAEQCITTMWYFQWGWIRQGIETNLQLWYQCICYRLNIDSLNFPCIVIRSVCLLFRKFSVWQNQVKRKWNENRFHLSVIIETSVVVSLHEK